MHKTVLDVVRLLFPIGRKRRSFISELTPYLSKKELSDLKYIVKLRRVGFSKMRLGTSPVLFPDKTWPALHAATDDEKVTRFVERVNAKIEENVLAESFDRFKDGALERISGMIAPNLLGLDAAKKAAALQLFCQEPVHILLVGDPGTGKTEILRSIERLAPHAVFGLGSGASKAGLVGMYEAKEWHPGLLLNADNGIACIDELNLLRKEDQAGLYSAMEKGFITYDKKGKHERHDARVRVLATANPKHGKFYVLEPEHLKNQLPFDEPLLSRFHLIFTVRRPAPKAFEQIARKIIRHDVKELMDGDARFVQEYVRRAEKIDVKFDDRYESMLISFVDELKANEQKCLVEISPRLVIGLIRMAKGFARARLARHTSADDVENAMNLLKEAIILGDDKLKDKLK